MNANISFPTLAPKLSAVWLLAALVRMMKMTVPSTVAMVVQSAARNVRTVMGMETSFEKSERGVRKIMTKSMHTAPRKRPNIHCEAVLRMCRMSITSCGKATIQFVSGRIGGL